jgi:hypothetical protein
MRLALRPHAQRARVFQVVIAVGVGLAGSVSQASPAPSPAAPTAPSASTAPLRANTQGLEQPPSNLRSPIPAEKILRVDDVKPGMVGVAHTVFQGTKPEPFKVRVVSVVRNFLPKQDVILVRAEDPRVEFSGIAAGMSGSPVYVDGKLMGAIAYAWSFAKEPLAGVTPIESMLAERSRPRRSQRQLVESGELVAAPGAGAIEVSLADPPETTTPAAAEDSTVPQLRRVSVPLSISGLSDRALAELTSSLKPFGIIPMRAGGGGRLKKTAAQEQLVPGGAVGVQLIRGDMNATAMGTVTWVGGNTLLAFGHPMFGVGEVNLPMVTGEVHSFINSQFSSFKLATPIAEVGTIVQDRPSCIVGDMSVRSTMLPIEVRVSAPGSENRVFRAEVVRNKRLTPILASAVLTTAIADAEPDQTDMAVTLATKLGVRGMRAVDLRDQVFTQEGLSPRALGSLRGVRALGDLLGNPFAPVGVDRLEFDVKVEFRRDFAEIVSVALPSQEVKAGDTVPLRVTLRPYAGQEYVETIPFPVPQQLAGKSVRIEVASGAMVRPDVPRPENLAGFIENLRNYYTASNIVVSLSLPDDGASLRGRLIPSLPPSALDTLRTGNQTRRADAYRLADRTVFQSSRLVTGKQELLLHVREDTLGRNR